MTKKTSLVSALLCCFIWGTTFIAQDTGMDNIGPYTFNGVRFMVGFFALLPIFFLIEKKNFSSEFGKDKKKFIYLSFSIGIFLFLGTALQQVALLYTDIANAAFFTIFYVPMVPLIVLILFKKKIHWSVYPSVVLCVIGGYLLTNFYDASVRKGDMLVIFCAFFWALHIIFIGELVKSFELPITVGLVQTFIVSILSLLISLFIEEIDIQKILFEKYEILYAGVLSGGFAFVLQIYAQKNIHPAPAAIIYSLEGVFAAIAAWLILSQALNINNILGCVFILIGVLLSQLLPEIKKASYK